MSCYSLIWHKRLYWYIFATTASNMTRSLGLERHICFVNHELLLNSIQITSINYFFQWQGELAILQIFSRHTLRALTEKDKISKTLRSASMGLMTSKPSGSIAPGSPSHSRPIQNMQTEITSKSSWMIAWGSVKKGYMELLQEKRNGHLAS